MRVHPAPAAGTTELRHGYTLSQVNALSVFTVRRQLFHQAGDFDHRVEIAWHAIIEHIYASDGPPAVHEVIRAAFHAITADVRRTQQFHGRNTHDRYAGTTAGFERYWWYVGRPTSGPEDGVVERVALAQIWPRLRPLHQQVLAALAAHDDYGRAADSLGKSRKTFTTQVGRARQEFLALWHEGETPSGPWGCDRRASPSERHSITYRTIRLRERARAAAGQRDKVPRPAPRTRKADLGITDDELIRRYDSGESIRQIAASLGHSYSVIHRRLHAAGAQFRSTGYPAH
ncbi:MAG TPA: helix-turn-helix domain-containing protein [Streptosporangiaceae bacterium]|jgi:hypothetical protein